MSDCTIIGLGPMGLALARVLLQAGYTCTVWNRTQSKYTLVDGAAQRAATLTEAIGASATILVCVADYRASAQLFEPAEVRAALRGKLLVQLSTGMPSEARESARWAEEHGVSYLDGAILALPSQMATESSAVLLSGERAGWSKSEALLRALAGQVSYLGETAGAAAAFDFAILSHMYGSLFGFYHGALVCEREGLSIGEYGKVVAMSASTMAGILSAEADIIAHRRFDNPESSLETSLRALRLISRHARESNISDGLPTFAADWLERAANAGLAQQALAAVVDLMGQRKGVGALSVDGGRTELGR